MLLFAIVFAVCVCLSFSNIWVHLHETPDLGFEHSLPCRMQLLKRIRLCNANDAYLAGDDDDACDAAYDDDAFDAAHDNDACGAEYDNDACDVGDDDDASYAGDQPAQ